ncbi:unnamed protein product [Clonostachys rosea]|uniref:TauD/TfdA-like domain-containing protein n=1 Tax=Bionectria ochroleuca TaxID=29856 RepID=A0ABY6UDT1_BIOOC|nr:unnamed protein product [Clonostachys rosea]
MSRTPFVFDTGGLWREKQSSPCPPFQSHIILQVIEFWGVGSEQGNALHTDISFPAVPVARVMIRTTIYEMMLQHVGIEKGNIIREMTSRDSKRVKQFVQQC